MKHDLHDLIEQLGAKMHAEYARIRKTASQDPGTAGDEGEENWAELLRNWLPPTYQIVTKGQLLNSDGALSPQVDVVVLKPSYPRSLHNKKKYLIAGVAAAFECKLTLTRRDVFKTMEKCAKIKQLRYPKEGTPYLELTAQPIFGLLAHSGSWKQTSDIEHTINIVDEIIADADSKYINHPRQMLDILCISDLTTWTASKQPLSDPLDCSKEFPATSYMRHYFGSDPRTEGRLKHIFRPAQLYKPLGVFITELLVKLAWQDPALRDIASYFVNLEFSGNDQGKVRLWPKSIYSATLRKKLKWSNLSNEVGWGEWDCSIE